MQCISTRSKFTDIAPEGPAFLARGGSPENECEKQTVAPDGAGVEDAELLRRVTSADGIGLGRDEAWHLRAARQNS
ncbi:hypothetical protein RISK_001709 [Rhodopirellula islandica]|uniref:Uncharacterized protein n=1 Tax=Rhodopirellula islandica TaxID=595434 RepID=A0A0J1BJ93_RHOIS|nr:hypothetical protein RISK_001709 [Rhodopirellula islandica]